MSRTTWVEAQAARFCTLPLVAETVFHSLRYLGDGQTKLEEEVVDLLLRLRSDAILVSLKAQDQPGSRDQAKLERWCRKSAGGASAQLRGAIKTVSTRSFWCSQWRRGRVDFRPGELTVRHAVVAVEMPPEGAFVQLPTEAELSARGMPITYISLNDLLNVVDQLRTFPDLVAYLDSRLALGDGLRRTVGRELALFGHYLHNGEAFAVVSTWDEVADSLGLEGAELTELLWAKHVADVDAAVVEHLADGLATRAPDCLQGPDAGIVEAYSANRERSYLIQDELCDLRLGARRTLGGMARELFEAPPDEGVAVRVCHVDQKPDFLHVVISAAPVERRQLQRWMQGYLIAGLAHYGKRRGMAIATRLGKGYEFLMTELAEPTADQVALGARLFGHLKITSEPVGLLPS